MLRSTSIGVMLLGVAAVVAGVAIGGTTEHPSVLFLPYLFATGVVEVARKRQDTWMRLGFVPVVLGLSAGGVAWTIGARHVGSNVSMLVWAGMALLIAGSIDAPAAKRRRSSNRS